MAKDLSLTGLADRMAQTSESATLAFNARAKQMAGEGKTIYNLTAGELASDTPEYIQAAVADKLHLNKYTPVAGLAELREQIAANASDFYGLDWIKPANVVVTAGAKPALYLSLLALINPGDEVIVPVPAWVSYKHLVELVGGKVVEVPLTEGFDLDAHAIKSKITDRTKAIILNSPHNPTGAIFSKSALDELVTVMAGYNIYVISDDIYAKLIYDDSFTAVPKTGFKNLVIINGFSKSQALTGWRVGYLIAEETIARAAASLMSNTMGNSAMPSQQAALAALERGDSPPAETLATLKHQRQLACQAFDQIPQLKYHPPGGAFYIFLDLRQLTDNSAEWCERLLVETGVALVPGEAFSAPGFARLSFVTEETDLITALGKIGEFVKKATA